MPSVPRYDRIQSPAIAAPSAIPAARFDADAPLSAFGGPGTGPDTANKALADATVQFYEQEKNRADQLAVLAADKEVSALETRIQYDPQTGAMNKRGEKVFGMYDEVSKSWKDETTAIEKRYIKNDAQRLAYGKMVNNRWVSLDSNLQRHFSTEVQKYDTEVTESYLLNEREAATSNYLEPDRIAMSISRQTAALIDHKNRNGLPEEWLKFKIKDTTSKTHVAIINRMLSNGEDQTASGYFKTNKPSISGGDIATVEKALEEGTLRGESQRRADDILGKVQNRKDALELVKKIDDPKLRDAVENRVNADFNQKKQAEVEYRNDLYLQAANIIDGDKTGSQARDLIPAPMWSELSLEQRNALEGRVGDIETDNKVWLDFLSMDSKQVAALSRADFETKYWAKFGKRERVAAEGQWNAAREASANPSKESQFQSIISDQDMVLDAMKQVGAADIDFNDTKEKIAKSEDKASAYAATLRKVDAEFKAFYDLNGRNPRDDEKKNIINNLMLRKVFVENSMWWDKERPVATLTADDMKKVYKPLNQIPRQARLELVNIARANGVISPSVPDDRAMSLLQDRIERAYATRLAGGSIEQTVAIMAED